MGYYIETPEARGKAEFLHKYCGAEILLDPQYCTGENITICVVDNGAWEAAGIIFSETEFERFNNPDDPRDRTWLKMKRDAVIELNPHFPKEGEEE
jgi:hypothetical protein